MQSTQSFEARFASFLEHITLPLILLVVELRKDLLSFLKHIAHRGVLGIWLDINDVHRPRIL